MEIQLADLINKPITELLALKELEIMNVTYHYGEKYENIYSIPDVFEQLQNIEYLSFIHLQEGHNLKLPDSVFKMKNLKRLLIGYNMEIDNHALEQLRNLHNLEEIIFHGAKIVDKIPENIKNMPKLKTLKFIEGNQIEQLNESLSSIFSCKNLEELHFSDKRVGESENVRAFNSNDFKGIEKLKQLKRLVINATEMDEIIDEIGELSQLISLEIRSEKSLTHISDNISQLENLKHLALSVADIRCSDSICSLQNLESLELLGFNDLPEEINLLKKLKSLKVGMSIKKLPDTFSKLKSLEWLDISHTNFEEASYGQISKLTQLKTLDVSGIQNAKLKEVPLFIRNLKQLQNLNLFYNKYEEIPKWLTELTELRALNLSHTNIKEIPDFFEKFIYLEELNIGYTTKLKTITPKLGELKNLKRLKKELVKTKKIMKVIEGCKELEELYLGNYDYKELPDFRLMEKLRFLNLNSVSIEKLKNINIPDSLQYLWLYDREVVEALPQEIQVKVIGMAGDDSGTLEDYTNTIFI